MKHRHITTTEWTLMAIESLFDRGNLDDWKEFARALRADPTIAERAIRVCQYREADGAEGIALAIIGSVCPSALPPAQTSLSD